jgi:hypothetical protein
MNPKELSDPLSLSGYAFTFSHVPVFVPNASSASIYRTGYGTNKGTTGPSTGLEIRTGSGSSAPTDASVLVFYAFF